MTQPLLHRRSSSSERPGRRLRILSLGALAGCLLLAAAAYAVVPLREAIAWRVSELRSNVWYALYPPEESLFTPNPTLAAMVQSTLMALTPSPSPTSPAGPTPTPPPSSTPTVEPTSLPQSVDLGGVRYERQFWNNCGPANLAMALSFWGWQGSQQDTAEVLKPNPRDKNVMPYEMEAFVEEHTRLSAVVRHGGDIDLLRRFLAAGFPVLIEKGFDVPGAGKGWMGHYQLLTGYDDASRRFTAQDSYEGPNFHSSYQDVLEYWRHFNYLYLIIYPPDRAEEVMALLGPHADETANLEYAAELATAEISRLHGRDLFFAWYNLGTSLVRLRDYAAAANAYDNAFPLQPEIPAILQPWRVLWYQTGPYFAYYFTGRYGEVIELATRTLQIPEPVLEESFYWRGLAHHALGSYSDAVADLRSCLRVHPGFVPCETALQQMGATP